jgi:hypothetical protein
MDIINFIPLLIWALTFHVTISLSSLLDKKPLSDADDSAAGTVYMLGIIGWFLIGLSCTLG